ncbi:MAG: penicillin-binding transpeptidase domain-containing protein [Planctomycetaceae bacterium]
MLNRPSHSFHDRTADDGVPWRTDARPGVRLAWLCIAFVIPLLAVVARLAYLQLALADEYVAGFEWTTESYEPIPSRDGRILSAAGEVLAYDVERFAIRMHYRWLEEPADPEWLRGQALSRLDRKERRDRARVDAEQQRVLAERARMWDRLAQLANVTPERLAEDRRRVQRRVERIIASVERRREERRRPRSDSASRSTDAAGHAWWRTGWNRVVETLTTPPEEGGRAPLIVREELDYHPLIEGIPLEAAAEIEAHPELYPGSRVAVTTRRRYANEGVASHVVGMRTPLDAEEIAARRDRFPQGDPLDYGVGDRLGRMGVEASYDRRLHGLRGVRRIVRDRRGEIVNSEVVREPRAGRDVVLALDLSLQRRAEKLLEEAIAPARQRDREDADDANGDRGEEGPAEAGRYEHAAGACIVALDVRTGAVLAAASAPGFDLADALDPDPETQRRLNSDPRRPFFPRMTRMALPPGSVFKPLSAIAVLQDGRIDPHARHECAGYLDQPGRNRCYIFTHFGVGHGPTDLSDALCRSCNVYFYDAARRMGPEPMFHWARELGFGQPTGIDLPGERGGSVPVPPSLRAKFPEDDASPWYAGDTLGLAIGQSRVTATPMQIARLMAVIANGGELVTPHVVRVGGPTRLGEDDDFPEPPAPRRISGLSDSTLARVREGLERVVADPRGTGYKHVRLHEVAIAGKTGTAEVGGGRPDHAWFAGYVPADRPRIAFVVVLEHAGSGGAAAGPVAREFVRAMLELGLVPPARVAERL